MCSTELATLSVSSLPLRPWLSLAPEVFALSSAGKVYSFSERSSRDLSLPSRVCTLWSRRAGFTLTRLPPTRFDSLRRFPGVGQPLTPELPALGSVTFTAFLTLSRFYSARHLPALFHAGPALGISLQGRFPPAEQCVLSSADTLLRFVRERPLQGLAPCECPCPRTSNA
jgi:hypothetical protein